ncbi:hypothetical protein, partial [Fischerella muscicola]|uniref:hypothetical protein n=1 Tax=Fischerella muscicola TaxID=92938 RepID=UPI001CA4E30C
HLKGLPCHKLTAVVTPSDMRRDKSRLVQNSSSVAFFFQIGITQKLSQTLIPIQLMIATHPWIKTR